MAPNRQNDRHDREPLGSASRRAGCPVAPRHVSVSPRPLTNSPPLRRRSCPEPAHPACACTARSPAVGTVADVRTRPLADRVVGLQQAGSALQCATDLSEPLRHSRFSAFIESNHRWSISCSACSIVAAAHASAARESPTTSRTRRRRPTSPNSEEPPVDPPTRVIVGWTSNRVRSLDISLPRFPVGCGIAGVSSNTVGRRSCGRQPILAPCHHPQQRVLVGCAVSGDRSARHRRVMKNTPSRQTTPARAPPTPAGDALEMAVHQRITERRPDMPSTEPGAESRLEGCETAPVSCARTTSRRDRLDAPDGDALDRADPLDVRHTPGDGRVRSSVACGVDASRLSVGALSWSGRLGLDEDVEHLADRAFLGDGFWERKMRFDLVPVAAAVLVLHHVAACGEVGDDAVGAALGDVQRRGDVA